MKRNELGHFIFSEEDIELLKQVQKKLQDGVLLQDISLGKTKRTGIVHQDVEKTNKNEIADKIQHIESSLYQKADSVVSYQILQHRREIEELQEQIEFLSTRLSQVEETLKNEREVAVSKEITKPEEIKSRKKKSFFQALFGS